ncbi:MAG: histidine kinase, partial [Bacteroidota bacterium]
GLQAYYTGSYDTAAYYFGLSAERFKQLNRQNEYISSLQNMTAPYAHLGNTDTMEKILIIALDYYDVYQVNDSGLLSSLYTNLGDLNYKQGRFSEAMEVSLLAVRIAEESGNLEAMIIPLQNVSEISLLSDEFEKALEYCKKALEISLKVEDYPFFPTIYLRMSKTFYEQYANERDSSLIDSMKLYALKTYEIAKSAKLYPDLIHSLNALGTISEEFGDYHTAKEYFEEVLTIPNVEQDKRSISQTHFNIGNISRRLQEHEVAIYHLRKSVHYASQTGSKLNLLKYASIRKLAEAFQAAGIHDSAYQYLNQFTQWADTSNETKIAREVSALRSQYEVEKKEQQIVLQEAQINEDRAIRNGIITVALLSIVSAILIFLNYTKRKRQEFAYEAQKLESRALSAQMNPHFVSNIMSSIKDCMHREGIEKASKYLDDFHSLLRMVLENSEEEFVTLDDELQALKLYIQLEELRSPSLKIEFQMDHTIEAANLLVPPLIFQPFVENALQYGVSDTEGDGILFSSTIKDTQLHIRVENRVQQHMDPQLANELLDSDSIHSHATRLTQDRLSVLNRQKNTQATLTRKLEDDKFKLEIRLPLVYVWD